MRIGILTFHWATNYGAILQAYALQTYLNKLGHEVYIINYKPKRYKKNFWGCFATTRVWSYLPKFKEYLKERELDTFRKSYLNETILYESLNELQKNPPKMDVYICGSDQIWNPYFTTKGEGKPTTSYFLDFGSKNVKRVAYAASFGCKRYPRETLESIKALLLSFNAISVRENSGLNILEEANIRNNLVLPDPTLLLNQDDYNIFLTRNETKARKHIYFYILRKDQSICCRLLTYFKNKKERKIIDSRSWKYFNNNVPMWLSNIQNADFVVTNSFHGMIFSLIFYKQFIVVPVEGSGEGMNDRIFTVLEKLDLKNRILEKYNEKEIDDLLDHPIDWEVIKNRIDQLCTEAKIYLKDNL